MGEELQKLDLSNAADQLRDKIKHAFVDLIPPEQWQAMIEGELKKFTTDTEVTDYNNRVTGTTPSGFSLLAQELVKERAKEVLLEKLQDAEFFEDGKTFESIIIAWLEANKADIAVDFAGNVIAQIMVSIQSVAASAAISALSASEGMRPDPNRPGYSMNGAWLGQ